MAILTLNTGQTFQEGITPVIDVKSAIYTPYTNKHRVLSSNVGSREIWYNKLLAKDKVTLSADYTAGGTMTFQAPTNSNDFVITPNVTHVETTDGSQVHLITAYNTATRVATLQLAFGSDANLGTGVELYLTKYDTYGSDFGDNGGDEFQLSKTDINYMSFLYDRLQAADGNEQNKLVTVGVNEAQIAPHEREFFAQRMRQVERNLFYSVKAAGTGGSTRQGNTVTSGLDSKCAGLNTLISAAGGIVTDNQSDTPVSEAGIIADVEAIRETGALTTMLDFERNEDQAMDIDMYVSEKTLGDINKFIKLERDEKALSAQRGGVFGSWATRLLANGANVNVTVSSGVKDNDYFMIPATADIKVKFMFFYDKIEIGKTGHNKKCMYATAFTQTPMNANTFVHRKNLRRINPA